MTLVAFDFDGTLVEGDSGVHFGRHLFGKGYLNAFRNGPVQGLLRTTQLNLNLAHQVLRGLTIQARYAMGHIDRHGMVAEAYESFKGLEKAWVTEEMARFARDKLVDRLRMGVVDQMEHHIDQGHHVVVVSTGIYDLIWPLRDVLGLDFEVVACRLRERDGKLTGTVEGPLNGNEKAMRLLAIAKRRDHELENAWAYGDHEDDAAVLTRVGNPVVVHPTRRMHKIAKDQHWPVLYDD